MAYLLDADVFIRAENLHYGLDFCPAFRDWLVAGNESGLAFSVEKVGDEVQAVADELSDWANERAFETQVEETLLVANGWQSGTNADWDVERALFPAQE